METQLPTIPAAEKPYESIPSGTLTTRPSNQSSNLPNGHASPSPSHRDPQHPDNTATGPKPWHSHLTLDLFARVLSRSIFHPAIVLIFYLCLAAIHKHRTPTAYYTLYWASFLAVVDCLIWLDHRVAYGPPRKVDWGTEVVVVTGGAKGLGRVLVERFVRRGVKVGVFDVLGEEEAETKELVEVGDLCWVGGCDVADEEGVRRGWERIVKELGTPTILINNAAAPIHGFSLLSPDPSDNTPTLTPSHASRTIQVNLLSQFTTLSLFLSPFTKTNSNSKTNAPNKPPNGGTIITLSSILPAISPANLSDYTASKAALSSLHHTLTHELQSHPDPYLRSSLKTILVEPGQLATSLFERTNVPKYMRFLCPVVDTNALAAEIVRVVERGEAGVVRMPLWAGIVGGAVWGLVPGGLKRVVRRVAGVDGAVRG